MRNVRLTMRTAILLASLVLIAAAGCGDDSDAEAGGGEAPARLSAAIKYEVIGGDAFRDDEMTIQADGRARVQTRSGERTVKLTAGELSALARKVDDIELAQVKSALTDPPQPDALSYRFTYRGRQVETDSGALPEQLGPLIGTFNDLIESYRVRE